ncbi:MAG: EAL domain-containing protein [Pseudolabrys sp.]
MNSAPVIRHFPACEICRSPNSNCTLCLSRTVQLTSPMPRYAQTAIDLAHRFGSVVVAEGIDAIADLQALIVMGCDFGQGTLLAPPLPKERFLDALRQHSNKPRAADHASQERNERVA